ncbi:MAG: hypothetical protein HY782_01765 [Chloroflexi bacterium]|nr:hypothetical protein [Chloroflexota bacterium]
MENDYYVQDQDWSPQPQTQNRLWLALFLFLSLLACVTVSVLVPGGLGFWAGYNQLQAQNHESAIQHFQRGLGYLAENYPELAYTEFEISIRYDPAFEPARQKLQEMQAMMGGPGTPGVSEEDRVAAALFEEARGLVAQKNWDDAINRLEQLHALNVNYHTQEANELLFQAYVASGKEAVAAGQIELARERFDAALTIRNQDAEVQRQRDLAVLYLDGQQAVGYNWPVAIQKFAALYQQDSAYDDVKRRLVEAYTQYGDLAMKQNASCLAVREYDGALAITKDAAISDKRAQAMALCRQAIVATPTPVVTPGSENYVITKNVRDVTKVCNTGTGDVSGIVRDALGQPLASVAVAYYADGINRVTTRTNANGQYQFTWGADAGLFRVIVLSADGKTPAGAAAEVQYPGGNKPGCHVVVDWQKAQ